jgi:hypothetical protein
MSTSLSLIQSSKTFSLPYTIVGRRFPLIGICIDKPAWQGIGRRLMNPDPQILLRRPCPGEVSSRSPPGRRTSRRPVRRAFPRSFLTSSMRLFRDLRRMLGGPGRFGPPVGGAFFARKSERQSDLSRSQKRSMGSRHARSRVILAPTSNCSRSSWRMAASRLGSRCSGRSDRRGQVSQAKGLLAEIRPFVPRPASPASFAPPRRGTPERLHRRLRRRCLQPFLKPSDPDAKRGRAHLLS